MRFPAKWLTAAAAGLILLLIAAGIAGGAWLRSGSGRAFVKATLESALAAPGRRVTLSYITGDLPAEVRIARAEIADRDGVWLQLQDLSLDWSPLALLSRTAVADRLVIGAAKLERLPVPPQQPETKSDAGFTLPVALRLSHIEITRLALSPALAEGGPFSEGGGALLTVTGAAHAGRFLDGEASLSVTRLDGTKGSLQASARYQPGRRLDLDLRLAEPAGGILAQMADLKGRPAVAATLTTSGTLDNWQAKLRATAGPASFDADATIARQGRDRRLELSAQGRLAALLPDRMAPLADEAATLQATIDLPADGTIRVEKSTFSTAAGALSLSGTYRPDRAEVDASYEFSAGRGLQALVAEPVWQNLHLAGSAKGKIALPSVSAALTMEAPAFQHVTGRLLTATLEAVPESGGALRATLEGALQGLHSSNPKLAQLAGETVKLSALALVTPSARRVVLERFGLEAAVGAVTAQGEAERWGETARAQAHLTAHDLALLGRIVGQKLAGSASADIEATKQGNRITAKVASIGHGVKTGQPTADALTAPEVKIEGALEFAEEIRLRDLRLTSPNIIVTGSGTFGRRTLETDLTAELPRLEIFTSEAGTALGGAARVRVKTSGPPTKLSVTVDGSTSGLTINGRSFDSLSLAARAVALPDAPTGTVELKGAAEGKPVRVQAEFATEKSTVKLQRIDAQLGGNRLTGSADVGLASKLAAGRLTGDFAELDLIGALAGEPLAGKARAELTLAHDGKEQAARLDLSAAGLARGKGDGRIGVTRLNASFGLERARTTPRLDVRLTATDVVQDAVKLDRFDLTAKGELAGGIDIALNTAGRAGKKLDLAMGARLSRDEKRDTMRVVLNRLDGHFDNEAARLDRPATIETGADGLLIQQVRVTAGQARASVDLDLRGSRVAAQIDLTRLPLKLVRLLNPVADIDGTLSGSLRLGGSQAQPTGDLKLTAGGVRAAGLSGLRGLDAMVNARWQDGRVVLDATADGDGGAPDIVARAEFPLTFDGSATSLAMPPAGALRASLKGGMEAARLNDLLAVTGDRIAGRISIDLAASGLAGAPTLAGNARLEKGRYENVRFGTVVTDIEASLTGGAQGLRLERLAGKTPAGGTVTGSGAIRFQADGNQLDIRLKLDRAQVAKVDLITATADADLTLTGSFQKSTLAGTLRVRHAEIGIPDRMPRDVVQLAVVEINGTRTGSTATPLPEAKPPDAAVMLLDLKARAENQVYVRGRGVDTELRTDLTIKGTSDTPLVTGQVELVKGTLSLLGKTFTLTRATATFLGDGGFEPALDAEATAAARDLTAVVTVTGRSSRPQVDLTSNPVLPRDEVLSRVLFDKSVGELGAFDAITLAQSAAELTGLFGSGPGVMDRVKRSLGVDRLELKASQSGQGAGAVAAGRYINRRTYVGVEQDLSTGQSRANVEYDINRHISVTAGVGSGTGTGSGTDLGVKFKWDY